MKAMSSLWVWVLFMALQSIQTTNAVAATYSDGMVRAAVVFGILRFTGWPTEKYPASDIKLCAHGDSDTIRAIDQLDPIPAIGNIKVDYAHDDAMSLDTCHAVILGNGMPDIYRDSATLLICDECGDAAKNQSAIVLDRGGSRIEFHINLDRVKEQGLKLNSSLIELAASCTTTDPAIRGCE